MEQCEAAQTAENPARRETGGFNPRIRSALSKWLYRLRENSQVGTKRQGTTSVVPQVAEKFEGFSPCGLFLGHLARIRGYFRGLL
jgi:hypothetical protein